MNLLVLFSFLFTSQGSYVMIPESNKTQWGFFAEIDTFVTYANTYGDIVIFSYADSNQLEVLDENEVQSWTGTLMENEHVYIDNLVSGTTYKVMGSKQFTVLSGDPFVQGLGCWFAVDENSKPASIKFLTVGPQLSTVGDEVLVVFSYHDNTHVTLTNAESQENLWEGDLDSAEYYLRDMPDINPQILLLEADKPVSMVTLSGVVGTYVPAYNGTFTGRDFMTYVHEWSEGPQDMNIIPWEDGTNVVVTDLDNLADTIWEQYLPNRGEIKGQALPEQRAYFIHSDKDISVSMTPWVSFGGGSVAFYMVRGIDRDGLGMGYEFFMPIEQSISGYESRLKVTASEDSTDVEIGRIPRTGGEEAFLWQGTMDRGETYQYVAGETSVDHAIYHVTASKPVSVIGACNGSRGADFLPLWFAIHPNVSATPDQFKATSPGVPISETPSGYYEVDVENNGNIWDIVNLSTLHSCPEHFTSQMYDELGGSLPDADGDGNPDTDTLGKGGSVLVLVDVFPSDSVPIGTRDTCFFVIVSSRDERKRDTALLVTLIVFSAVAEEPGLPGMEVSLDMITNILHLSFSSLGEAEVSFELFDATGRKILSQAIAEPQTAINVSDLSQGVYFVSARIGESERLVRKVIIY